MQLQVLEADYSNAKHAQAIVQLLNAYASDPMGGNEALTEQTKQNLLPALAKIPGAFSILAMADGLPVGLVNCFQGFSTFVCQPLINVHDVYVLDDYRGSGISLKTTAFNIGDF